MENIEKMIEACLHNLKIENLKLVELLMLVDCQDGHLLQGYCSLNDYLRGRFEMSHQQAYFYANAVRLIKRHPEFLGDLKSGELCLSNLDLVARKAEEEAIRRDISKQAAEKELLDEAKGKSKRGFKHHLDKLAQPPVAPLLPEIIEVKSQPVRIDQEILSLLSELRA